jgi:hypothetical protein
MAFGDEEELAQIIPGRAQQDNVIGVQETPEQTPTKLQAIDTYERVKPLDKVVDKERVEDRADGATLQEAALQVKMFRLGTIKRDAAAVLIKKALQEADERVRHPLPAALGPKLLSVDLVVRGLDVEKHHEAW